VLVLLIFWLFLVVLVLLIFWLFLVVLVLLVLRLLLVVLALLVLFVLRLVLLKLGLLVLLGGTAVKRFGTTMVGMLKVGITSQEGSAAQIGGCLALG
jgi:hypothetical protein